MSLLTLEIPSLISTSNIVSAGSSSFCGELKNIIMDDASLNQNIFKDLVNLLKNTGYLIPEKELFKLTSIGENFYNTVKRSNFS